jgi:hypothetical protein
MAIAVSIGEMVPETPEFTPSGLNDHLVLCRSGRTCTPELVPLTLGHSPLQSPPLHRPLLPAAAAAAAGVAVRATAARKAAWKVDGATVWMLVIAWTRIKKIGARVGWQ